MDLFSIFKGGKYFDKHIEPKCDYCQFGKRAKDGNKVLCEKRGLVDCSYSCNKFVYSPLKRIPVKQLNFVGSLADEDIYIESAGDRAEKEAAEGNDKKTAENKKLHAAPEAKPAPSVEISPEQPKEAPKPAAVQASVSAEAAAPAPVAPTPVNIGTAPEAPAQPEQQNLQVPPVPQLVPPSAAPTENTPAQQ